MWLSVCLLNTWKVIAVSDIYENAFSSDTEVVNVLRKTLFQIKEKILLDNLELQQSIHSFTF